MNIDELKELCNKFTVEVSFNGFLPFKHKVIDADMLLDRIHEISELPKYEFIKNINEGNFMYNDANICLKRKADKCLNYRPVNKVADRNIVCSHCDSINVWMGSIRGKSRRYKCNNCKKCFSIKL